MSALMRLLSDGVRLAPSLGPGPRGAARDPRLHLRGRLSRRCKTVTIRPLHRHLPTIIGAMRSSATNAHLEVCVVPRLLPIGSGSVTLTAWVSGRG